MKKLHLTRFAAMATVALLGSTSAWALKGITLDDKTLTLQSNADNDQVATEGGATSLSNKANKIIVNRANPSASWSTLMLPVTVNAGESAQIKAAYFPTSYNSSTTTLNMQLADNIQANKPYLVQVSGSPTSFEFNKASGNYTVEETGDIEHSFQLSSSCWEFKGVYLKTHWAYEPGNVYGYDATDGKFVKAGDNVTIYPLRAYLTCSGSGLGKSSTDNVSKNLPDVINVRLFGKNGETLSIGTMNTRTGEIQMQDRYYDLKGRKLNGKPQNKIMYVNKKVIKH